jgi:hypothetical protein
VIVFDPLAVILLLASQYSFQWFRQRQEENENTPDPYVADVGEKPTEEELDDNGVRDPCPKCGTLMLDAPGIGVYCPNKDCDVFDNPKGYLRELESGWPFPSFEEITPRDEPKPHHPDTHPYLRQGFKYPEGWEHQPPMVATPEKTETKFNDGGEHPKDTFDYEQETVDPVDEKPAEQSAIEDITVDQWNKMIAAAEQAATQEKAVANVLWTDDLAKWREENPEADIYEIQRKFDSGELEVLPWDSSKKKNYMIREEGTLVKKTTNE